MESNQQEIPIIKEVSVSELMDSLWAFGKVLYKNWWKLGVFAFFGLLVGVIFSYLRNPVYTAESSFVVESKSANSALSSYAGLASQFGINLSGAEGNDLFQSSNIIQLMSSRTLINRALLKKESFPGGDSVLADRFMDVYDLKKKWKSFPELNNIQFSKVGNHLNVHYYDALRRIYDIIIKNNISVEKDKKSEIISLKIITENEMLSKFLCQNLVQEVSDFYIETKTRKIKNTLSILQKKTDSVKNLLFGSIEGLAISMDANANLVRQQAEVGNKFKTIRISALQSLYGELSKNLEATKLELINETPLIQYVDTPILPLEKTKISRAFSGIMGALAGLFLGVLFIWYYKPK